MQLLVLRGLVISANILFASAVVAESAIAAQEREEKRKSKNPKVVLIRVSTFGRRAPR